MGSESNRCIPKQWIPACAGMTAGGEPHYRATMENFSRFAILTLMNGQEQHHVGRRTLKNGVIPEMRIALSGTSLSSTTHLPPEIPDSATRASGTTRGGAIAARAPLLHRCLTPRHVPVGAALWPRPFEALARTLGTGMCQRPRQWPVARRKPRFRRAFRKSGRSPILRDRNGAREQI